METKKCKCCGRELPLSEFTKGKFGVFSTCKECVNKKRVDTMDAKKHHRDLEQEIANAKKMRLADFSPRDLMEELANRGIDGEMSIPKTTYTKVSLSSFRTSVSQ